MAKIVLRRSGSIGSPPWKQYGHEVPRGFVNGTVWGIMRSFTAVAGERNTSLAVVAAGIAEALFATVIGAFAMIPAVIAYNMRQPCA